MFTPNIEAFWNAVVVLVLATPFMFLTLTLFTLLAVVLSWVSRRQVPPKHGD